ncbi:MAG: flagellar hook-associated protein FlgL [Blastocatellia bacterium]
MNFRVTNNTISDRLTRQINNARQKQAISQEQLATGKKINRPSDDPFGTAVVLDLRNTQTSLEQFTKVANLANTSLTDADSALNSYQNLLDRVNSLLTQGLSDTSTSEAKKIIAIELDSISQDILKIANTRSSERYIFGGTQQDQAPFDPNTSLANPNQSFSKLVQIEPNQPPVETEITASNIFSNTTKSIFNTLADASAALKGTGDPVIDKATLNTSLLELDGFIQQANSTITKIGKNLNQVQSALERLGQSSFSIEEQAQSIEAIDFAKVATQLVESGRALDAILSSSSTINKRSLIDFLG